MYNFVEFYKLGSPFGSVRFGSISVLSLRAHRIRDLLLATYPDFELRAAVFNLAMAYPLKRVEFYAYCSTFIRPSDPWVYGSL
jgi:hypothetical protein